MGALLAAACGSSGAGTTPTTGETVVLGAPLGLSGALVKESELTQQGYDLWAEWINGQGGINVNGVKHPVKIKYYDDTSDANQSAILMQKLITDDKAQFLLGPYGSAATATDARIAEQNKIPMVSPASTNVTVTQKGDYIFRVCFTDDVQGLVCAQFAQTQSQREGATNGAQFARERQFTGKLESVESGRDELPAGGKDAQCNGQIETA